MSARQSSGPGRVVTAQLCRMMALVGRMPGPEVTRATSAPSTWELEVPRSWRTASMAWVSPSRYTSERLPPWVLTGSRPVSKRSPPSSTNGAALPGWHRTHSPRWWR